jgi:integrase
MALAVATQPSYTLDLAPVISLVTTSLSSPHSRRAYTACLNDFLYWHGECGRPPLSYELVQGYRQTLEDMGKTPSTINQSLKAIKALARILGATRRIEHWEATSIASVPSIKQRGVRTGNWLSKADAQALLDAPDITTPIGLRDRGILAVFLGCALRRQEVCDLECRHIQQREGHWAIIDLVGKGQKVRSVPMAPWTKVALDDWTDYAGITEGHVFRPVRRGTGRIAGEQMTPQALLYVVRKYIDHVAPHDLRRTWAKLAHKGGSPIEQISLSLGHSTIQITQRYLGIDQDFTDAPCDHLGLRLG